MDVRVHQSIHKFINNKDASSILGRRKMTQRHKKETQETQNETKIPHGMRAMRYYIES